MIFRTAFQTSLINQKQMPYIKTMSICPIFVQYTNTMSADRQLRSKTSTNCHIQGDSGGICNASGNDSMCDSKQKQFI
jgi:hypothetical protein